MASSGPLVSFIIPAYNEEARLRDPLIEVAEFAEQQDYSCEVIVVDDGSTDQTANIVESLMDAHPVLRLQRIPHGGKGAACQHGMLNSSGEWRFICDCDLSMPIAEFARFHERFGEGVPILIGSREAPGSQRHGEPWHRHLMGRVFNYLVQFMLCRGIRDTQCGFKCFRADVAEDLFQQQTIKGWAFDVEVLFLARQQGITIFEIPINWYYRDETKVRALANSWSMFREVCRIRFRSRETK